MCLKTVKRSLWNFNKNFVKVINIMTVVGYVFIFFVSSIIFEKMHKSSFPDDLFNNVDGNKLPYFKRCDPLS